MLTTLGLTSDRQARDWLAAVNASVSTLGQKGRHRINVRWPRPVLAALWRVNLSIWAAEEGQTDRQVMWHDASRSQWQEYALEIGEILHIFPSVTRSMGDRGSKKAYTGPRTGIYLPTKFGCDRSIVVGCGSRND